MSNRHTKMLIIGSGPAGYTAAIYAARAMLEPVLIAGMQQGGQLTITTDVENYPGYAEAVQGPWMMEQMLAQARHVGTDIVTDTVTKADLSKRPFRFETDSGQTWTADSVVICTGAQAKWLGLPSEQIFMGFGVSACATCDGFFYKGKRVIVVGGGNTAVEEALYLSGIAGHVTLVHRRDELRAEQILQRRLMAKDNVTFVWDSELTEITGSDGLMKSVDGASILNRKTGETSRTRRRRHFHRHRPRACRRSVRRPVAKARQRLSVDRARFHRDRNPRRLCGRRRDGRHLPASRHRCRARLHGGTGSGEISRRNGKRCGITSG